MLTFDFVMLTLIFGWLEFGKNLFCNVYIMFFYFCFKCHDVNITQHIFLIGQDIWECASNILLCDVCILFTIQRLIYHMWMFLGNWLLHLHIPVYDVYIVIQHVHIENDYVCVLWWIWAQWSKHIILWHNHIVYWCKHCFNVCSYFVKWKFYVHIHFNDVCIVFDQVHIVIEHIYGLGVILWKWHKHLSSWCIHFILRCKD